MAGFTPDALTQHMDVYLVGGAVRDKLLGLPTADQDWVVVGQTPEAMLAQGFTQVGRDFPVFLHPHSHEEYALARTERKTGQGHLGFVCHAGVDVTLAQDLERRDLTINAIAMAADGSFVDPFQGQADLQARLLRHVSPAFVEDPLRLFRVARFAAKLADFNVAEPTALLMRELAAAGELSLLSAERVWQELAKALLSNAPQRFLAVLQQTESFAPWLLELAPLNRVMQAGYWLQAPDNLAARFALLVAELDAVAANALAARLKTPRAVQQLALQRIQQGPVLLAWLAGDAIAAAVLYQALATLGAFKPRGWPQQLVQVLTHESKTSPTLFEPLHQLTLNLMDSIQPAKLMQQGFTGAALGEELARQRIAQVGVWLSQR